MSLVVKFISLNIVDWTLIYLQKFDSYSNHFELIDTREMDNVECNVAYKMFYISKFIILIKRSTIIRSIQWKIVEHCQSPCPNL